MLCKGIVKDNVVTLPPDMALCDETVVTIVIPDGGAGGSALGEGKPNAMDVLQLNSAAANQVWNNPIDEVAYKDVDWRNADEQ